MNEDIASSISNEQFKAFFLEQVKRYIKKLYKGHLKALDEIQQAQLKAIYESQLKGLALPEILPNQKYSEYRKQTLDVGNEIIREIENLFGNIKIAIDNKNNKD